MKGEFNGLRVTVMGLGRFGGGAGVTEWLAAQGARVLVTDLETEDALRDSLTPLRPLVSSGSVTLRLGGHAEADFQRCDLVVANPAIPKPWDNRYLAAAAAARVPVTTEIRLLADRLPSRAKVIGVTGSMGKSTTASMIAHILASAGRTVVLGGNIGGSLLGRIASIDAGTYVVLELSSAMLHWLGDWSARTALVTNFAPNHADWHGDLAHYERSKRRILAAQVPGDIAVLGHPVHEWPTREGVWRIVVGPADGPSGLLVPGFHNRQNGAMAVSACCAVEEPALARAGAIAHLRTFRGLPHRLEFVAEHRGVRFFNDSKSTTPGATLLALEALDGRAGRPMIHLIAGGYDKGLDLRPLTAVVPRLAGVYTIGATGDRIADAAGAGAVRCGTLAAAVGAAWDRLREGDVLLLSPGCASWDQYPNYEFRGRDFRELVAQRIGKAGGVP